MLLALHVDGVFAFQQNLADRDDGVSQLLIVLNDGGQGVDDVVGIVVKQNNIAGFDPIGTLFDDVRRARSFQSRLSMLHCTHS